jgi:hypothetical protein
LYENYVPKQKATYQLPQGHTLEIDLEGGLNFQLHMGCSSHMLPPIIPSGKVAKEPDTARAWAHITWLEYNIMEVQDNSLATKSALASNVNRHCSMNLISQEVDCIMLTQC